MTARVEFTGLQRFLTSVDAMDAAAHAQVRAAVGLAAHEIERASKVAASGRPGPNVVSGHLRRGITVQGPRQVAPGVYAADAGPTAAYGRRIELGFVGADSLGRHFNQPPFPFLKPGFEAAMPAIASIMRLAMIDAQHEGAA